MRDIIIISSKCVGGKEYQVRFHGVLDDGNQFKARTYFVKISVDEHSDSSIIEKMIAEINENLQDAAA